MVRSGPPVHKSWVTMTAFCIGIRSIIVEFLMRGQNSFCNWCTGGHSQIRQMCPLRLGWRRSRPGRSRTRQLHQWLFTDGASWQASVRLRKDASFCLALIKRKQIGHSHFNVHLILHISVLFFFFFFARSTSCHRKSWWLTIEWTKYNFLLPY